MQAQKGKADISEIWACVHELAWFCFLEVVYSVSEILFLEVDTKA